MGRKNLHDIISAPQLKSHYAFCASSVNAFSISFISKGSTLLANLHNSFVYSLNLFVCLSEGFTS